MGIGVYGRITWGFRVQRPGSVGSEGMKQHGNYFLDASGSRSSDCVYILHVLHACVVSQRCNRTVAHRFRRTIRDLHTSQHLKVDISP